MSPKKSSESSFHKPSRARKAKTREAAPDELESKAILLEAASKVGDQEVLKVVREAKKIEDMAQRDGPLDKFFDDIRALLAMVRDYASGAYREVPFGTIAAIVGALLYVLSPIDLIPDFIPVIGLIDDAAVVGACLRLVGYDIQKYRKAKKA